MPKYPENLPTTPKERVMSDREGRYFFADLPAGEYFLQAAKEGYAGGTYGQRRAWGQKPALHAIGGRTAHGRQARRCGRYGAIAGTVVDEAGEPVVGVGVNALVKDVVGGRHGSEMRPGSCRPPSPTTAACSGSRNCCRARTW